VAYILTFVAVKAGSWGFHMNFYSTDPAVGVPGIPSYLCLELVVYFTSLDVIT